MTIEDYRKNLDVIADINLKDEQLPAGFRIGVFSGLQLAMRLLPEQFDTVSVPFGQLVSNALEKISYRLAEMQEAERGVLGTYNK